MRSYRIGPEETIDISPSKSFFGANSLLQIKVSNIPYERRTSPVKFNALYGSTTGQTYSLLIEALPPYFFEAITPDMRPFEPRAIPWFNTLKIQSLNSFAAEVEINLNTKLHTDLENYLKTPNLIVKYKGRVYNASYSSRIKEETREGQEWIHNFYIITEQGQVPVVDVKESPDGRLELLNINKDTTFNKVQLIQLLKE